MFVVVEFAVCSLDDDDDEDDEDRLPFVFVALPSGTDDASAAIPSVEVAMTFVPVLTGIVLTGDFGGLRRDSGLWLNDPI